MTMERVGVQAVVEGAGQYLNDAQRINTATFGMGQAAKGAEDSFNVFARAQEDARARLRQTGSIMRETGTQAIFLGAALAAPGALAVKFAVDFESAFAGVRKTVDATEGEFGRLRTGILDLSSELPTSAAALADVAANAGQLGIAKADIIDFTRTAAQLGETTNLSAVDAATGLARFANVLGLNQDEINRTGAALVDLGNKGAATESEILDISQRLAAAGKTIGLSASEVLAFGEALSSVGVEAEAGGTAFSRVFIEIAKAVEGGGANLDRFAQVAGTSADQFAQSFRTGPANAVATFVEGLGRLQASGQGTFGVLEELSLNDARLTRALLSAASAGDLFRTSLATGANAFRENSALTREFGQRLQTTGAQFGLLINELRRFAIDTGTALLPAAQAIIATLRGVVGALNSLPTGFKAVIGVVSLLGGGLVIAAGTLAFFAGSILSTVAALGGLSGVLAGGASALTAFGSAFAFVATAIGVSVPVLGLLIAATTAAIFAYHKLTAESEAVSKAQANLKKATEAVTEAQRDAAKAAKDRKEAEGKGEIATDVQKAKDIQALAEAELRLAEAINAVAAANEADAIARAKRFKFGPSGPVEVKEPLTAAAAAREPGAGLALLGEARAIAPRPTAQTGAGTQAGAFAAREAAQASESVRNLAREITNLRDANAAVNPELVEYIGNLTEAQRATLTDTLATIGSTASKFKNFEAQEREQQAEAAGIGIIDARVTAQARAISANRETRAAVDEYLKAQRNLDAVLADSTSTTEQVTQAQHNADTAYAAVNTSARAAAGAVREASVAYDANIAVTNTDAEANKGLADALAAVAAERSRAAAPGALGAAEALGAGRGEEITTARTATQRVEDIQKQAADAEASNARRVAAASAAGKGGASILERQKSALEGTEKRQREEQAAALIRERVGLKPGEKGLSGVQAEQARLDAAFSGIVDELAVLGFEVPEEFRDMFDRINSETEDGAKKSGRKIGGLLGFLIARRFNQGLDPTAGIISQPAAVTASLTRGTPREAGVQIANVNIGAGVSTGDIQQGMGVAFRGAFGSQ